MSNDASYCYRYPRPALTTDAVLTAWDGSRMWVLLIRRGREPFEGRWALPGGFVEIDEDLPDAVARELAEETGARGVYLEQLATYGRPGRDPRGRTVSVAYLGLCRRSDVRVAGGDDAARADWFDWAHVPPLAFDHDRILADARARLAVRLQLAPLARHLLPDTFTSAELATLQEHVTDCPCADADVVGLYLDRKWIASVGTDRYRFVAEP